MKLGPQKHFGAQSQSEETIQLVPKPWKMVIQIQRRRRGTVLTSFGSENSSLSRHAQETAQDRCPPTYDGGPAIYLCIYMYMCVYVFVYIFIYVCIYIYVFYTYKYLYTHIYIHTYIYT